MSSTRRRCSLLSCAHVRADRHRTELTRMPPHSRLSQVVEEEGWEIIKTKKPRAHKDKGPSAEEIGMACRLSSVLLARIQPTAL